MGGSAATLAALFYPAFQAMVLRWWLGGLRFGMIDVRSTLRMRHVYGAYLRFLSYGLLFSLVLGVAGLVALFGIGLVGTHAGDSAGELAATGLLLVGYVVGALGFSTIYRATVLLSLWKLGAESLDLSGLGTLDTVKAAGRASSPLAEGLADALNVGGI